jgi:hypothetical protein
MAGGVVNRAARRDDAACRSDVVRFTLIPHADVSIVAISTATVRRAIRLRVLHLIFALAPAAIIADFLNEFI